MIWHFCGGENEHSQMQSKEKQLIPAKGLMVLDGLYWSSLSTTLVKMFVQLVSQSDELISAQNPSKTRKIYLLNQRG